MFNMVRVPLMIEKNIAIPVLLTCQDWQGRSRNTLNQYLSRKLTIRFRILPATGETMRRISGLFFIAVALLCTQLQAAAPRLTNVLPRGVQRGIESKVTLYGSNLKDAEELMIYDSGIEVVSLTPPEDEKQIGRQLIATLKVKEDCRLGTARMRVRTRTGLTDLQNVHVGALPIAEEKEPNTDFAVPQVIQKNTTIHGRIDREDVDYYQIEAKQGERISVEVFGMRLGFSGGGNYFDPFVSIMDEKRFELAVSDDTPLVWNDAVASVIAPADGKYIVQIRDSAYNGDGRAYYLAHIGNFPRPRAVIPSGGKPGETLTVTFLGDVSGPITREVTLPTEADDRFGLDIQDDLGVAPSTQAFRVTDLESVVEQEPNNDRTKATAGVGPGAFNGIISEPKDIDFFKFNAKKGQQLEVEVYARRIRTGLDPVVYIYDANGKQIVANDDSRGPDSYVRFNPPADGEYTVAVRDHLQNGHETYAYRIEMKPIAPALTAVPIEFSRYVQPQIIIPQGAGSGVVATISRQNIGGPVNFRGEDLPAGVHIECPEGWRPGGSMPVVFYAAADAPVAGKYSTVHTYLDDPNQKDKIVAGPLMQKILMIRGRNNQRVWEESITRMPIIVTDKAPFKVWIEKPSVPLVRGGSMNLLVKCEKDEGWDEDISVLLLQNPSGVNSSRSVKIPKGKTEASIPLNAAGNAAVAETPISLRCIAKVGDGNIELCTPFVPIRVEEQYVTLEFAQAAVEQGSETAIAIKVKKRKDFEGEAEVTLLGLPANTEVQPMKLTKDQPEIIFSIKATEKTPPGMSKNVFCRVMIPENGATILHNLGTGRLRVDKPLPPKKDAPPKPKPKPVEKKPVVKKPLSRLEMLRLEQKERAEAEAGK